MGFDGFCKFYTMVLPWFLASNRFPKGLHDDQVCPFLHFTSHATISLPKDVLQGPCGRFADLGGWAGFQDPEWVSCQGGDSEFKHV